MRELSDVLARPNERLHHGGRCTRRSGRGDRRWGDRKSTEWRRRLWRPAIQREGWQRTIARCWPILLRRRLRIVPVQPLGMTGRYPFTATMRAMPMRDRSQGARGRCDERVGNPANEERRQADDRNEESKKRPKWSPPVMTIRRVIHPMTRAGVCERKDAPPRSAPDGNRQSDERRGGRFRGGYNVGNARAEEDGSWNSDLRGECIGQPLPVVDACLHSSCAPRQHAAGSGDLERGLSRAADGYFARARSP